MGTRIGVAWIAWLALIASIASIAIAGTAGGQPVPAPPIPGELLAAIEHRSKPERKESMQGTALAGGALEYSIFAGDLSSATAAKPGATFDGWRGGKPLARVKLVVTKAFADPCTPGVTLYQVTIDGKNPCAGMKLKPAGACEEQHKDEYGESAVAVPGGWGLKAQFVAAEKVFTLACAARGVIAKCARWGYRPWVEKEAPLHRACVRAARADYCGADRPVTAPDTEIDLVDREGLRPRAASAAEPGRWRLEADWNEDGATCLDVPRLPCCADKVKLAAAIRSKCGGRALPACKTSCAPGDPTCGSAVRTWMAPQQRGPIVCDEVIMRRFCP